MRNKRPISYCNFVRTDYEEKDGRKTGNKTVVYADVKTCYGTVSAQSGSTSLEMFGTDEDYDKTIVLDMNITDITENSVFWIDKAYTEGVAHDYIVRRIIRNINYMFVGLRKVNVQLYVAPTPTPTENTSNETDNSVTTE